jgi:hypothetical protein
LERELEQLRAAGSQQQQPASVGGSGSAQSARLQAGSAPQLLSSLGIGTWPQQQPQAGTDADLEALRRLPLTGGSGGATRRAGGKRGVASLAGVGVVPLRTMLLLGYGMLLHVALMVSLNQHTSCHHSAVADTLPGH